TSKHVCLGVICWFNSHIRVAIQAGTGWNELTDDDIFLEAQQRISLAFHCSLCQNTGGFLEGRSREPGLCCQRGLSDPHQFVTARSRTLASGHSGTVGCHKCDTVGEFTWKQVSITGINNGDSTQHLADDDFHVLVVNATTLRLVYLLNFVDQELLGRTWSKNTQYLFRIDRT